jgi:hypothetical protein
MTSPARSHMKQLSNVLQLDHLLIRRLGPTGAARDKYDTKTDYQILEQSHVSSKEFDSLAVCSL